MRYLAPNALSHPGNTGLHERDSAESLYQTLNGLLEADQAKDGSYLQARAAIYRQLIPRAKYPKAWAQADLKDYQDYWTDYVERLSVPPDADHPKVSSSSPTVLSASQRMYDAELTRRDSVNGRCTTVLSTAGILGTLVIAASQLGLIRQGDTLNPVAWIIYVLFLISLGYLICSVVIALRVQGDVQGEVFDARDLYADFAKPLDQYNFSVAKRTVLYGLFNWCMNNKFKYRLHSAQRCLRNGLIAIVIAGAISPWALASSPGSTSSQGGTTGLPVLLVHR